MIKAWDERRHLAIPGDEKSTIHYAVEHWIFCAKESVQKHGAFYVALSGGSTPKAIYKMLSNSPFKEMVPWEKTHLFWGDERSVPLNHPDSNFKMAMDAGLKDMPIPQSQIHPMITDKDLDENALAYEATIRKVLGDRPFDLIMLGMGDDGHTASLFPHTKALHIHDRLIIENHVPQKETWRMTMTYPCINSARHIAIYVLGENKKTMVSEVLKGIKQPDEHPIQKIGTPEHPSLWILDKPAASAL